MSPLPLPPRQILAVSGGGYRGLYTAAVLEKLEGHGVSFGATTDMFAGTSVGSLIALGIAAGKSAKEITDTMLTHGTKIFPPETFRHQNVVRRFLGSGFSAEPLREALTTLIGDVKLGELPRRVLIPAVNLSSGTPRVFQGGPGAPVEDRQVWAIDAALASAAAPTYLSPHMIDFSLYVDGGVVANAPDALAVIAASDKRWDLSRTRLLSISTGRQAVAIPGASEAGRWGLQRWRTAAPIFMQAQMALSRKAAQDLLGQRNVLIVDPIVSEQQWRRVGLDKSAPDAKATLLSLADTAVNHLLGAHDATRFVTSWRSHRASHVR
jgi:uncharacterized protein